MGVIPEHDVEAGEKYPAAERRGSNTSSQDQNDDVDDSSSYASHGDGPTGTSDDANGSGIARITTRERAARASQELKRTTSNALSHVASRLSTRGWPEPPPPPDGGVQAWTQVAMGWLVIFTTWGYVNSFGSFQTYYTSTMPETAPSAISWIGSVQIWLTLIIGAFSGRLLDAGWFLPTFFVGAVLQVLGMFLMSLSTRYWQLMLTQGILTGIGGGIFFTPSLALVATYFSGRRALAVGLTTTGNSAGGIVYPVVVRQLIPLVGFAWTARVLAFINLACLAVVFAFMRPRLPPRKSGPIVDLSAFKEPVYVGFVFGVFFLMWANYYTFYYIASFGVEKLGLSYSDASILVIILNGAGLPFRVIPPLFADRIGPINVLIPVSFTWVIVAFCWLAVKDVPGYYAFTVFYGIASGAFQCLIPTTVASITKHLNTVGTRLGMAFSIVSFASLTGPPIGGALQSARGGEFSGAQGWAAGVTLLAFLFFSAARVYRGGWKLSSRC
ncbi:major facilitator superfamily domain-containing protein [Xylariomycetidae sp. FL2044]|nr:major facilitator superfamily domain-containing protein [Xylariomycetidae sp. FL2044]